MPTPPLASTRPDSRRRRRAVSVAVATALLAMTTVLATFGSAPAGATTLTYVGSTSGTQSTVTIHKGDKFERVIHPSGNVTATLDDTAKKVTSANVTFAPAYTDTFTGPFGILVYVKTDLTQVGPATGTATPVGTTGVANLAVSTTTRLGLTVFVSKDGSQQPATDQKLSDPSKCSVDLALNLTGTADRRTGALNLGADPFTIPTFPSGTPDPAKTCEFATGALNQQVAGTNNSIDLHFTGGPTSAHYTGVSKGTQSAVTIKKGDLLFQRTINPTGSLVADIDFVSKKVTNVVTKFDPLTIKALPGVLGALPAYAKINLTTTGTPTASLTPSGKPGIDNVSVSTGARMAVTVSLLSSPGVPLTNPAKCFVDLKLNLTGTVDRGTDTLTLSQSKFTIPSFPVSGCGLLLGPGLSLMVSGANNSINLTYVDGVIAP